MYEFEDFESREAAAEHFRKKLEEARKKLGNRKGPYIQWMKEYEDDSKTALQRYDLTNGIPTWSRAFNDLNSGIVCLAGLPNAGKSTCEIALITGALQLQPDTMIIDISHDDPMSKRYTQYICSLSGLHYQEVTTETELTEQQKAARDHADSQLNEWMADDRLRIYESTEYINRPDGTIRKMNMRNFRNLFTTMKKARDKYPDRKIVVFIDSWNNMDTSTLSSGSELNQADKALDMMQEKSNELGIPIIMSAHLRKTTGRKATLEDIKGTTSMAYVAVGSYIVRNEFREGVVDPIMFEAEDGKMYPMIVIETVKTKISSWDLPLMYGLKAACCQLMPLTPFEYENAFSKRK